MNSCFKTTVLVLACLLLLSRLPCTPVDASNHIGFQNSNICISSPQENNLEYPGLVTVSGTSPLSVVWFCTRSPAGEMATYKSEVCQGAFSIAIPLRFGPGKYSIWASSDPSHFDGSICFTIRNVAEQDTRFTSASNYIDSDHERIVALAEKLDLDRQDEWGRVQTIHKWMTAHICYDCEAFLEQNIALNYASQVLERRQGLCRDYAFLFAALSRHSGIPCKVVYGQATDDNTGASILHAWNEVFIAGEWRCVDVTWDAGYINDCRFVQCPSQDYLAIDKDRFAQSHQATKVALH